MSELPPVPDIPDGGMTPRSVPYKSPGASSDPIESGPTDPNQQKIDNAKLDEMNFSQRAKKRSFYFTLGVSTFLFLMGTVMFAYMSLWKFGWQTILILFAFFTPATVALIVMIHAVYGSSKEKAEDKKDDLSDMLPSAAYLKALTELIKAIGK